MTHTAKAIGGVLNESSLKELEKAQRECEMCANHTFSKEGTPVCSGKPVYKSAGQWFCEKHALGYMEADIEFVFDIFEEINAGLFRMAKGERPARPTKNKNARTQKLKKISNVTSAFMSAYDAKQKGR